METNFLKELNKSKHFFCISHFNGSLDWISYIKKNNYIIYNKSGKSLPSNFQSINIENVGYNLYSYLKFIVDNYESLPDSIIFCKDNVFQRHVNLKLFTYLISRNTFTPIEDQTKIFNFPTLLAQSDNGFTEINSSWYKYKYERLFFSNFNSFYNFIFKDIINPLYLRYAPGANYIVKKENILLRKKIFYKNLIKFISHSQYSCESHYLERSIFIIWNSNVHSSEKMNSELKKNELLSLQKKCFENIKKEKKLVEKISQKIIFKLGKIYIKILKFCLR